MAAIMFVHLLITIKLPHPNNEKIAPATLKEAVVNPFKEFMTRQYAVWILLLVIIYKLSEAFALALNTPFLLRAMGFSLVEVASMSKLLGSLGGLLGCLLGGLLLPKLGQYRSLLYYGFLQMCGSLLFALLVVVGKSHVLMAVSVFAEYFFGGLSSVAFVSFLMSLCNMKYSATQYALLSAVMQIASVVAGPEAAWLVAHFGWFDFYLFTFLIGFPGLILLAWLHRGRVDFSAQYVSADQLTVND
jgi:MFS transporter, PAT family, beta-lactamase induction signal transducer AmpG